MRRFVLAFLCCLGPLAGLVRAECLPVLSEEVAVVAVDGRGDITLGDGRIIRLAGLLWPRAGAARARMQAEVSAALLHERVLLGDIGIPDRWNRRAAQVHVVARTGGATHWLQGQLVEDGAVLPWPEAAARGCWAALSERMMLARSGRLGLFSPLGRRALRQLGAKTHSALPAVVLYEGRVRSVRKGRSMTFVNFAGRRGATPALFLPAKMIDALRRNGRDAATFAGKRIRIWADVAAGTPPRLSIASVDALEVLE